MMDMNTGKIMPNDHPIMVAILNIWDTDTTLDERKAWHAFTCKNSRDPDVLATVNLLQGKFWHAAAGAAEHKS